MDKRQKDKKLKRLRQLYAGLMILVICLVALTLLGFFHGFKAGWNTGEMMMMDEGALRTMTFDMNVKNDREFSQFGAPVGVSADSTTAVYARVNAYDVLVAAKAPASAYTGKVVVSQLLSLAALACGIAVFLFLFKILASIKNSLKKGTVFSRKVVKYMRYLGVLVIATAIAMDVSVYLAHLNTIETLSACAPESGLSLAAGVPVDSVTELFAGVMIMFIAEVFALGYDIEEEQELTI